MSLYPDLDDVAAESPVATKELAELRAKVKELEDEVEKLANGFIGLMADNLKLRREAGARVKELEKALQEIAKLSDEPLWKSSREYDDGFGAGRVEPIEIAVRVLREEKS